MDVKVGDVVTLRGTVVFSKDEDGDIGVQFVNDWQYVRENDIVHVEPRLLQVGDKVKRLPYHAFGGEIRAVEQDLAWVKLDNGTYCTAALSQLERA